MYRIFSCICVGTALLLPAEAGTQSSSSQSRGCARATIDHVPIVVRSLDEAQRAYERLGFRIKPGRVHANGLRNAFAKLVGGDYLELISPERGATDEQARRYMDALAGGEGGAALALRVDSLRRVSAAMESTGIAVTRNTYGAAFATLGFASASLRWLFLIEYLTPVNDPAELLTHPNTALGIASVSLTRPSYSSLAAVAGKLCVPGLHDGGGTTTAPVAGVTIVVRSVRQAQALFRASGFDVPFTSDHRGQMLLVPASEAHGIWLEFLEPADAPDR